MEDFTIEQWGGAGAHVILAAVLPVLSFESRRAAEEVMNKMISLGSSHKLFSRRRQSELVRRNDQTFQRTVSRRALEPSLGGPTVMLTSAT